MKWFMLLFLLPTIAWAGGMEFTTFEYPQTWHPYTFEAEVTNVELVNGGLEITYRNPSPFTNLNGVQEPATVWKDVYCVKDGKIVFCKRVVAKVTPGFTVPEKVEWPK